MLDTSIRILIADDMGTMRKVVTRICEEIGYSDIIHAINGMDGWQKLQESDRPVGLVISDWNMPKMTGVDFLKRVRNDARFSALPFVMLTAEADRAQIEEALTAGVSCYVTKPFSVDVLRSHLEVAFQKNATPGQA